MTNVRPMRQQQDFTFDLQRLGQQPSAAIALVACEHLVDRDEAGVGISGSAAKYLGQIAKEYRVEDFVTEAGAIDRGCRATVAPQPPGCLAGRQAVPQTRDCKHNRR